MFTIEEPMKRILFLAFFLCVSFSGFAQYGRLEPIQEGDTTFFVLRTPKETLKKFAESDDKNIRKIGAQIETIERNLNFWRASYFLNRMPSRDMTYFINTLKSLERKGVNVSNYVQEALFYSTSPTRRAAY